MSIWEDFDKSTDLEGLVEDIKSADDNTGGEFKEVPVGEYEVEIEKLELDTIKNGKNAGQPKLSVWMNILTGDYQNSKLFYNQGIHAAWGIHFAKDFLKSLDTKLDIQFTNYKQFNDLIIAVNAAIEKQGLEYQVKYSIVKDFNRFEIIDVFESEE
jgi:hypothetical protein